MPETVFHVNSKTETYYERHVKGLTCLKCLVPFGQRTDERDSSFMSSISVLIIDDAAQWFVFSGNLYHPFPPFYLRNPYYREMMALLTLLY